MAAKPKTGPRNRLSRRLGFGGGEVLFYSRPAEAERRRHLTSEGDFRELLLLLACMFTVSFVPMRHWARVAHMFAGIRLRRHLRKRYPDFAASFQAALDSRDERELKLTYRATRDARHRRLLIAAAELASRGWNPQIETTGLEALEAALNRGNGVIIWCNSFAAQTLIGKRALHEAGLRCHQVSVSEHGFTLTPLGKKLLNPWLLRAEQRYLAGRITFERGDTYKVAKRISAVLKQNGVVLMTNNIYSGSSFAELGIGQSAKLQLATAPVNFAVKGKAALFTLTTLETEPFRSYEARLEPVFIGRPEGDVGGGAQIAAAMAQVRDQLLQDVRRAPEQFMLWSSQIRATSAVDHPAGAEASPVEEIA